MVEQGTHNPKVTGSNPVRAKKRSLKTRRYARVAEWLLHWIHNPWLREEYSGSNPDSCKIKLENIPQWCKASAAMAASPFTVSMYLI